MESVRARFETIDCPAKVYGSVESLIDVIIHLIFIEWAEFVHDGFDIGQFEWKHSAFIDARWIDIISSTQTDRF
jgi:hypothetical protein